MPRSVGEGPNLSLESVLTEQRRANHQRDLVSVRKGLRERPQEEVLALPRGDPTDDGNRERTLRTTLGAGREASHIDRRRDHHGFAAGRGQRGESNGRVGDDAVCDTTAEKANRAHGRCGEVVLGNPVTDMHDDPHACELAGGETVEHRL